MSHWNRAAADFGRKGERTMRKWLAVSGILLMAVQARAGESPVLKTDRDRVSYAIGVEIGKSVRQQRVEIDPDLVIKGVSDGLSGGTVLMSDDERRKSIAIYKNQMRVRQNEPKQKVAAAAKTLPEDNRREGDAFLAANKAKAGVVALPSGLQYKILKAGDGAKPTDADTVECRYRGTFVNGTEFDNSDRTGKPATFKVSGVIPGWKEALALMPVGSRWQLFIPPRLAYGEVGAPPMIGPNATLIFEMELVAIK